MAPPLRADEGVGYWSPRTANIDWCEGNYEVRTLGLTTQTMSVCARHMTGGILVGLDKQVTTNKKDFIHLTRPEVTGNLLSLPFSVYLKINVF